MKHINTENSKEHWEFINVKDRIVLDLGCGRWDKMERVDSSWLTTPEHFIFNGAKKVIAVDIDPIEINWFKNKFIQNTQYEFLLKPINSATDIVSLYNEYQPNCVKSDIETGEKFLLLLDQDIFSSVDEYYIETHGHDLYENFLKHFQKFNYKIREEIDLTHTNGYCKVIFAYR